MVFRTGDDAVPVRWYRAEEGALWAPDGNVFTSHNWSSRDSEAGDLGEQPGTRPWRPGANEKGYRGDVEDCIDPTWFVGGIPAGETTGPWDDTTGKLECCTCVCDDLPCTLHATITSLSGCDGFAQSFDLLSDGTSPCLWIGGGPDFDGSFFFSLSKTGSVYTPFIDCTTPLTSFSLVTQQDSPLLLVYDADAAGCCCSSLPCTGTWRITITQ
jgi:hypothetical protein